MAIEIKQDHEACIGCGACASVCPDNWEMGDDGKAHPIETEVEDVACNEEAADICPVSCIEVIKE